MEPRMWVGPASNPLLSLPSFLHQHCLRVGAELTSRLEDTKRLTLKLAANLPTFPPPPRLSRTTSSSATSPLVLPFASVSQSRSPPRQGKQVSNSAAATLSSDHVARTLAGTSVYTVSNSDNEFVLISDPNGGKSIGLLCFRHEDAEAFLAQVYMLKVEGIAFRFLPADPVQIKNALEVGGYFCA